ncbi:MAG TPA: VWA domain-containing protein [Methylomirabilota bacterium]|nr:VWA domain-containing protein [Methylomirabilota bacterium]
MKGITFQHWWFLFALLLLPLAAWLRGKRGARPAFVYSSVGLLKNVSKASRSRAGALLHSLRWLAMALLIIALARPQKTRTESSVRASGIDIVIALDLSGSMESEDFEVKGQRVNRLVVAKDTISKFIEKRPSDRIGLVAFAGRAYIAAPLTLDHDFLQANLQRLNLHTIEDGTAIGSGLAASVNRLRELRSKSKIVILMTDGQNNAGKVPPLTAAEAAKALDVKVYTIGVGIRGNAPFPQMTPFGKRYVMTPVDIDEDTLTAIADKTGGKYFRADSTDTLRKIYAEIDQFEKSEAVVKKFVQREELFRWVAVPGLLLLLLEISLANTIWRRLP